jgi:hypothetical protein
MCHIRGVGSASDILIATSVMNQRSMTRRDVLRLLCHGGAAIAIRSLTAASEVMVLRF